MIEEDRIECEKQGRPPTYTRVSVNIPALPEEVYDKNLPARTRAYFEKADAKAAMAAKDAKAAKSGEDIN